jgi:hypothetical protein
VRRCARLKLVHRGQRPALDLDGEAHGVEASAQADPLRESRCVAHSAMSSPKPPHLGRSGTRRVFRAKVPLEEHLLCLLIDKGPSRTPRRHEGAVAVAPPQSQVQWLRKLQLDRDALRPKPEPIGERPQRLHGLRLGAQRLPKVTPVVVQMSTMRN